jgi:hypothetical protein
MKPIDREKRSHPRVKVVRPVIYRSDIYPKIRVALTKDLSPGGVKIEDTAYLYTREGLSLWFSFEPRVIHCRGRVIYVHQRGDRFQAGISFESMAEEDRRALSQYVSNLVEEKG